MRYRLGSDQATCASAVLDDDGGAERLAKPHRNEPGDRVGGCPRDEGHDQADRTARPGFLRVPDARQDRGPKAYSELPSTHAGISFPHAKRDLLPSEMARERPHLEQRELRAGEG